MTFEEVVKAGFVRLRDCSICEAPIGFRVHDTHAAVVFDGGCDCSRSGSSIRIAELSELAELESPKA